MDLVAKEISERINESIELIKKGRDEINQRVEIMGNSLSEIRNMITGMSHEQGRTTMDPTTSNPSIRDLVAGELREGDTENRPLAPPPPSQQPPQQPYLLPSQSPTPKPYTSIHTQYITRPLSSAEINERRKQGLCFHCDEKYTYEAKLYAVRRDEKDCSIQEQPDIQSSHANCLVKCQETREKLAKEKNVDDWCSDIMHDVSRTTLDNEVRFRRQWSEIEWRGYKSKPWKELEQVLLNEENVSKMLFNLISYMSIILCGYRQESFDSNNAMILHSALVACSRYLFALCISSQGQELTQVLLTYPKVDIVMNEVFATTCINIQSFKIRLMGPWTNADEALNHLCQHCEALRQFLQLLSQHKLVLKWLIKNKGPCGKVIIVFDPGGWQEVELYISESSLLRSLRTRIILRRMVCHRWPCEFWIEKLNRENNRYFINRGREANCQL